MGVFQTNVFQNNVFQGPHGALSTAVFNAAGVATVSGVSAATWASAFASAGVATVSAVGFSVTESVPEVWTVVSKQTETWTSARSTVTMMSSDSAFQAGAFQDDAFQTDLDEGIFQPEIWTARNKQSETWLAA